MRLILKLISDPNTDGAYYMPTYDLLRLRAMVGVEEDLNYLGLNYSVNKSEYSIAIEGYGKIIFRSYDRPERIVAYEVAHSIVDEIDTLPKEKADEVWRKITERNRQKCNGPNTIGAVTTPDGGINGFIAKKWFGQKLEGYEVIKAPTYSNPFLPDGYIDQIRANYDPLLADMYIEGELVSLTESKVYHFYNREQHNTERELQPNDILHISLDFNVGGCCAVIWVIDNETPIAVGEFVSHDTQDFVNNLAQYKNDLVVYPDSSGKSSSTNASATDIQIIKQGEYKVDCPSKNPFIRDRINSVNALLAHNKIKINAKKCPNLAFALETQGYTKAGEPEKFNEHPAIDDWNDSAGYFLHRKFPVNKPKAGRALNQSGWAA